MIFDDSQSLLYWYFNKRWKTPPKMPGNHSWVYSIRTQKLDTTEDAFATAQNIKLVMNQLSPRNFSIMKHYFTVTSGSDIARILGLTERRIRQLKNEILEKLTASFKEESLVRKNSRS